MNFCESEKIMSEVSLASRSAENSSMCIKICVTDCGPRNKENSCNYLEYEFRNIPD